MGEEAEEGWWPLNRRRGSSRLAAMRGFDIGGGGEDRSITFPFWGLERERERE